MTNVTTFSSLPKKLLQGMQRGVERETLRMQQDGFLAQTSHPKGLGSALTHPKITTDYSEALLEFITSPKKNIHDVLKELTEIHAITHTHLADGEKMWAMSMPCMLDEQDDNIPLAYYGTSNIGRLKTLYRRGLGVRYGRRMQTIAGVHYNLSFPDELFEYLQHNEQDSRLKQLSLQDYRSQRYFGLIRNFIRLIPLVIYALGASPAVCRCFLTGRQHHLQEFVKGSFYLPKATALRMGNLGYQNSAQKSLGIAYNDLNDYLKGLQNAVKTPFEPFAQLGLVDEQGEATQINDHILQIENEYYSLIRPKQIPQAGETPSQALANRGVAYVELRAVDVNPYSPIGIDTITAGFLESLALYCLMIDSPIISTQEQDWLDQNQQRVVNDGRNEQLTIQTLDGEVVFKDWAIQHLNHISAYAQNLDEAMQDSLYSSAIQTMINRVLQPEQTLSAQILTDIQQHGSTWKLGDFLAQQHQQYYQTILLNQDVIQNYQQLAQTSLHEQAQLENQQDIDFNTYLKQYR